MFKLLPEEYAWLLSVRAKPPMLFHALRNFGIEEKPGEGSNHMITSWAREAAFAGAGEWIADFYKHDGIAWCGLFVAMLAARSGYEVKPNCLSARGWLDWGEAVETPGIGDVLVFWRVMREGRHGHVGLYVGEDDEAYHVLGGNQGDEVSIIRISKDRFLGARRWKDAAPALPHRMGAEGKLSENEA